MQTIIIKQNNILTNYIDSENQTLYIIKGECILTNDITLADNSILRFEIDSSNEDDIRIGSLKAEGDKEINILCNRLIIDAPKGQQIFKGNIKISPKESNNESNNINNEYRGIVNEEISAHWFGAKGDGTTDDTNAIQKALDCSPYAFVVLENLTYKTESTITIHDNKRLRCKGTILSSAGVAIDLIGSDIELDITELKSSKANYESGVDTYQDTGVLFSGNVWNSKISIDNILYFKTAIGLVPTKSATTQNYIGIQYCQISWLYIRAKYGIYFNQVNIISEELPTPTFRTWINENQFNGGRLYCKYGIYSEKASTEHITKGNVAVMNGNVFNSVAFEGSQASESNQILCKAITLSNASHSNFNDIRLSEGYIDHKDLDGLSNSWIELDRCSYLRFTFKSLIPYKAVNAQRCNNIRIEAQICDNGLGNNSNYDCLHIINSNSEFNPLKEDCKAYSTHIFASRHMVPSQEFNRIYIGNDGSQGHETDEVTMNLEDLYKVTQNGITTFSDKCYITVRDNFTLNISMTNPSEKLSFNLPLMLICRILPGSTISLNSPEKSCQITQSGLYYIRPTGNVFEICAYTYNPETNLPESTVLSYSFNSSIH